MNRRHVVPPRYMAPFRGNGKRSTKRRVTFCVTSLIFVLSICLAAVGVIAGDNDLATSLASLDPGPRPGPVNPPANPGNPVQGLTSGEIAGFQNGLSQFIEVEPVNLAAGPGNGGLGPAFNSNSCGSCHSQPAPGGTSPSVNAFPFVGNNPQVTVGKGFTVNGQTIVFNNQIPFFVQPGGPVREARFKSDSGVHDLFTIAGDLADAPKCTLAQPDFEAEAASGNLSFRIPTPVFGAGLIENIAEDTILANLASSANVQLGIRGILNRSGNDGSITRFGWKAQNKSLLMFAGEAYNVEMGVTNELFTSERGYPPNPIPPGCLVNPTPEDITIFDPQNVTPPILSDVAQFAIFMRFLDQPAPACGTGTGLDCGQAAAGKTVFTTIGCANCHTPSLTTTTSEFAPAALSGVQANLFSDLALHHMGSGLADGVTQGNAGPDQFRTSPLWGLGQRVYFLHDGRTSNLAQAISEHESSGSEANRVIENYKQLPLESKHNLIVFLRSL